MVLAIFIWTDFQIFCPDETSQVSWEDCTKCMCKVSEKIFVGVGDIHPDGQHFQILCQFKQTKMISQLF